MNGRFLVDENQVFHSIALASTLGNINLRKKKKAGGEGREFVFSSSSHQKVRGLFLFIHPGTFHKP